MCGKIKFLFCHPSSSLRTKKISACAQGGLVAKSVKRCSVNLRIRVRFQLNSTRPFHPPSTFSIADSSANIHSYPIIANRIPMRNFCRQCHQSVWMTFVTISSSGLVSRQFKANAPNCLSTHCCELTRVTLTRMHREKTVAEA